MTAASFSAAVFAFSHGARHPSSSLLSPSLFSSLPCLFVFTGVASSGFNAIDLCARLSHAQRGVRRLLEVPCNVPHPWLPAADSQSCTIPAIKAIISMCIRSNPASSRSRFMCSCNRRRAAIFSRNPQRQPATCNALCAVCLPACDIIAWGSCEGN